MILRDHNNRHAIVLEQTDSGMRLVELTEGELVVRTLSDEQLNDRGFRQTLPDYPLERAIGHFLNHSGGVSEAARRELLQLIQSAGDLSIEEGADVPNDNSSPGWQMLPDADVMNTPITVTVGQLDALSDLVSGLDSCCCAAGVDLEQKVELVSQMHDQIMAMLGEHVDLVYFPEEGEK